MRCNDFDAHIDEMLSGILHPESNQHMHQCERCTSHYRARAAVQNGLRALVAASANAPSHATDCAVMEGYRRLQQRRAAARGSSAAAMSTADSAARVLSFPSRTQAPVWASRTLWSGAAAAAVVFAVLGSAVHLWNGTPVVNAPIAVVAPAGQAPQQASVNAQSPAPMAVARAVASAALRHASPRSSRPASSQTEFASASGQPMLSAKAPARTPVILGGGQSYESEPVTQVAPGASQVLRLASTGAVNSVAQSASSTWPGYSNLMYCDPVVCSGPMQVVHIKVPVGQVKPNVGQTVGNGFVNAEVVVGPDGVARAIRVAN
jgi:hypothetical protein